MLWLEQFQEGELRVNAGDDGPSVDFLTALQCNAGRLAVLDDHLLDAGLGADLGTQLSGRRSDRFAHRTGAAFGEPPGPEHTVDLAHVVVQQHVGRAGRADAEEGADDAAGRHGRLERLGLEPLVEEIGRAHRHELAERVELFGR